MTKLEGGGGNKLAQGVTWNKVKILCTPLDSKYVTAISIDYRYSYRLLNLL